MLFYYRSGAFFLFAFAFFLITHNVAKTNYAIFPEIYVLLRATEKKNKKNWKTRKKKKYKKSQNS